MLVSDMCLSCKISNCAVAIQWFDCMQFIAMQAGYWISMVE